VGNERDEVELLVLGQLDGLGQVTGDVVGPVRRVDVTVEVPGEEWRAGVCSTGCSAVGG